MIQRQITDNIDALLETLPPRIAQPLHGMEDRDSLLEVVMDLGRMPEARLPGREVILGHEVVTVEDLDYVTERIGALDEAFLARDRPLGQARVLWEIGADGADIRALRSRLGLDSGYLARMLRTLQRDGLIESVPDPSDRRTKRLTLTARGSEELRTLVGSRGPLLASAASTALLIAVLVLMVWQPA